MIDGSGRILALVVVGCLVVGAWGVARESRYHAGHEFRHLRMAAGLSLMAVAIAGGNYVIRQERHVPGEARGYGVVVEGVVPTPRRGFDIGLALAQSVRIDSCDSGSPVEVTLQVAPTAQFWVDNHSRLEGSTTVSVLIPAAEAELTEVSQGRYGMDPFTRPADDLSEAVTKPDLTHAEHMQDGDLVVDVTLDHWAEGREPLRITYTADLVDRLGLGSCVVDLPALTGLPTVISGATLAGQTRDKIELLTASGQQQGLFIVSMSDGADGDQTDDPGQQGEVTRFAYYDPRFEITRGVTVLDLSGGITEDDSYPSPDANFSGSPAWTCRSTVASDRRFIEDEDRRLTREENDAKEAGAVEDPAGVGATPTEVSTPTSDDDPYFSTSRVNQGTYALSRGRIDEVLAQKDCAAQARLVETSAGSQRDVVVMFVGALFSAGVAWASTSVRRRRIAPGANPAAGPAPRPSPGPTTRRMLATIARGQRRRRRPDKTTEDPQEPSPGD